MVNHYCFHNCDLEHSISIEILLTAWKSIVLGPMIYMMDEYVVADLVAHSLPFPFVSVYTSLSVGLSPYPSLTVSFSPIFLSTQVNLSIHLSFKS